MYLEEIIADIKLENDKFECKARLNRNDIVGWLKTDWKYPRPVVFTGERK